MTVTAFAQSIYLSVQAQRVKDALDALILMERDLNKDPETRNAVTHEVVQVAIIKLRDVEEALVHEAKVLGEVSHG